jgi:hypothetical protein
MIDDLYDDRLAAIDAILLFTGTVLLVGTDLVYQRPAATAAGGALISLGILVFTTNMVLVLRRHSPHSLDRIVLGSLTPRGSNERADESVGEERPP